ncbi:hypothetical protein [Selenihalanaerobacter shriftii]|uniref:YceG-like family protein n=1 Tax=Selenihalanaerobacter shriftii TaxID=142842 RepID=A0A1T4MDL6_9FIRM|nr:hypothetical protein [Selenihalanaerobacter shriftii]SJZ64834.1 hypothetical protein SAMN02745118_01445 [Selenihalanaerobacter shriftii]
MLRKSLLGIGILLIIFSLLLIANGGLNEQDDDSQANSAAITKKATVIKKARQLGMEFPDKLSDEEIKTQLKSRGLKSVKLLDYNKDIIIEIKKGTTANKVVDKLYQAEIIEEKTALSELIEKLGVSNMILAGKYKFKDNTPIEKVLLKIIGN